MQLLASLLPISPISPISPSTMSKTTPIKLSPANFARLLTTLENTAHPLGELCRRLWESPFSTTPPVPIATTIAALLQDHLLPHPPQRLVAIYLLYDMIISQPPATSSVVDKLVDSPFTIVLFDLITDTDPRSPEQLFLSHLFSHSHANQNDLPMIGQISKAAPNALWAALEDAIRSGAMVATRNISSLTRLWSERHPDPTTNTTPLKPVSAVIPDPDPYVSNDASQLVDQLRQVAFLQDFSPTFIRPPPPFLPITQHTDQLRSIHPEPLHQIIWDPDITVKGDRGSQLRDIISRAIKSPIPEAQRVKVLNELGEDPKLVYLCGLTPENMPDLVNNNSKLATEILLRLASSNQMPQYLHALVNMDMNMNSMEVVSCLSSKVQLPTDFMHTYISNCISSCAKIRDKYGQIRMVRCVCVFLKTLMQNKTIEVQNSYIEVQDFCIEYSRSVCIISTTRLALLPCVFTLLTLFKCYHVFLRAEFEMWLNCIDLSRWRVVFNSNLRHSRVPPLYSILYVHTVLYHSIIMVLP